MRGIYRSETGARLLREQYQHALQHWPVDNQHHRIPTPEGETFVVTSGPATAPPLVLLHGSGANTTQWSDRISSLAEHFRVHAVDLIGEPGLSAPARPPLASDRHARWLDAVLDALGIQQTPIMGISLGGWIALDYATRRPGRVRRLALTCPLGIGRQKTGFLLTTALLGLLGERGRRRSVTTTLGPGLSALPPELAGPVVDQVRLVSRNYRYRMEKLPVFDDTALRRLTMPLHVLLGERDVMVDSRHARQRLRTTAPHATVQVLPGVGHFIPPQEAAELAFLTNP
ncbi:alpha/beta fold hydrolase [Saccharopolyspora taberi]|uniref:Alpha/beta hydrolase n=1 Tax=Saccharopolyspora taberi TaxID=60895 RepID=A0ABN3VGC6_9PSEU